MFHKKVCLMDECLDCKVEKMKLCLNGNIKKKVCLVVLHWLCGCWQKQCWSKQKNV